MSIIDNICMSLLVSQIFSFCNRVHSASELASLDSEKQILLVNSLEEVDNITIEKKWLDFLLSKL